MDILTVIKKNGCHVSFNSNGQLLDKEKSIRMVELGVDEIVLSIDSINTDLYKYHHRGGKLDVLMTNIEQLNSIKRELGLQLPKMVWYFVAMKSNIGELTDIVKRAADIGFSAIQVAPLNPHVKGQKQAYLDFYTEENLENVHDRVCVVHEVQRAAHKASQLGIDLKSYYLSC
jgi:MoaA/NifB/PqqE/SkfB family radical SAM enzyme